MVSPTMVGLRPWWGRVAVLPSPVDEMERDSGLVIPIALAADDGHRQFSRGIVLHVASCGVPSEAMPADGSVVYYENADRIGDVDVVNYRDIIAVMEGDS